MQRGDSAGGKRAFELSAREFRITGTRAPSTRPAASAWAMKVICLASILPASMPGTTSTSARPATSDRRPLVRAAAMSTALSIASGPSTKPAPDLSALGHLGQDRRVDRRRDRGVHGFDRRQDPHAGAFDADGDGQVYGVLHDVDLGLQIGRDVDRGIGHQQG
jgi:hypothetical protein